MPPLPGGARSGADLLKLVRAKALARAEQQRIAEEEERKRRAEEHAREAARRLRDLRQKRINSSKGRTSGVTHAQRNAALTYLQLKGQLTGQGW